MITRFFLLFVISTSSQFYVYCTWPLGTYSPSSQKVSDLINQASIAENQGDIARAIQLHKEIVILESDNILSINTIAGLYGLLEMYEEEILWATKALSIDENFDLAYINYGNALCSLGKNNDAREAYNKAQKIDPKNSLTYYNLGVLAEKEGSLREALQCYKKAIELGKDFAHAYFNLGTVYANLKRYHEAIDAFRKVLTLEPNAEDARQMIKEMEEKICRRGKK